MTPTDKPMTVDVLEAIAREVGQMERRHCIGRSQGFDIRDGYAKLRAAIEQYGRERVAAALEAELDALAKELECQRLREAAYLPLIRDDFERRMKARGHGSVAMSRLSDGEYMSPAVEREWEAEKRKYSPLRNLSGRGDAPAEDEATIPMARLIEMETAEHERDILRTNTQSLAMMLRKCAHRLKCNGHEDLSADVVGLLRRYGLLGSPLRGAEAEHG